ncbi:MAG: hypothetical protein ACYC2T_06745 [Bacillota bacterium]
MTTEAFIQFQDSTFYKVEFRFQPSGGVESPPEAPMFSLLNEFTDMGKELDVVLGFALFLCIPRLVVWKKA